jgi:hypothetical protein
VSNFEQTAAANERMRAKPQIRTKNHERRTAKSVGDKAGVMSSVGATQPSIARPQSERGQQQTIPLLWEAAASANMRFGQY